MCGLRRRNGAARPRRKLWPAACIFVLARNNQGILDGLALLAQAPCRVRRSRRLHSGRIFHHPLCKGTNRVEKLATQVGQRIFDLRRGCRRHRARHEPMLFQITKGGCQHLLADLTDLAAESIEAIRPSSKYPNDEHRPFVADPRQRPTYVLARRRIVLFAARGGNPAVSWCRQGASLFGPDGHL